MSSFSAVMPRRESRAVLWVRRFVITIACLHLVFFCWSIYRRIWQVLRIEVSASSTVLAPGATVSYDVITSGETSNRIRLELLQGSHAETLYAERAAVNAVSAYDPRVFRYVRSVVITPELLARFQAGPATLRLIGFGGQKLLHVPSPRVRRMEVQLAPVAR